jgi:signal transduction histidine kinase
VLEEVLADERPYSARQPLRLVPGTDRLAFHYTAPALAAPSRVRFRYRLEGLDRDWVEAGERRVAYYSHLPPGRYRFVAASGSAEGAWNEAEAAVVVELLPHLWQTWWFSTLVAAAALLAVALLHRARVRRLQAREGELQRLIEERTRGLQVAKESAEQATREAEHQRHLAEEADALKTELLGIAAHDLRNPLQLVSGLSELMSQGLASGPKVSELSHAVYEASRRMLEIVNSLLTTAALDRGLELRPAALNLAHLAADVLDEHGRKAASKNQRLLLEAEEDCRLLADYDRVRQILDNLISNAIKFSPRGGDVQVRVRGEEKAVRLEVRDHGPGLTEQDMQQAFHRFARLSARPTGDEPATGLGLSIVKGLVELHGGKVWAESEGAGRGAAFIVELPRSRL